MNDTTPVPAETPRLPPVYCAIARLTPAEADAVVTALDAVICAILEARYPDIDDHPFDVPRCPIDADDDIPF